MLTYLCLYISFPVNRVSVFRNIVKLGYQDGSSMADHLNAFQGLINRTTSLDVPLVDEVLALLLLGSLSGQLGDIRHIGQRRNGTEASLPREGDLDLIK